MILRLMVCILFCFLGGCMDSKNEIDKVSDHILCQLAKQMKKKGLIAIGSGGGCTIDKKINDVSIAFQYDNIMNINESRKLIVYCVQKLLNLMNSNPENKQYFEHFPAPVDIVHVSIFGKKCPTDPNCVEVVKILCGTIYYNIDYPPPRRLGEIYLTLKEESFEEAQKIVESDSSAK